MPRGIRNIVIVNALLGLYYLYVALTFYQRKQALGPGVAPIIGIGFTLSAILLPWRQRIVWKVARALIYVLALTIAVWAVLLLVDGGLFKVPLSLLLYFVLVFYLIGVRGYLATDPVRTLYGVDPVQN